MTRTAKVMGRPKTSISHNIKRLEQNLGAPLFDRSANAMRLNATGLGFLDHARRIRRECETARETVRASRARSEGQISIASTSEFASNIMSSIFMDFAIDTSELDIRAMTHPREVLAEVRDLYDCIIYLGDPPMPEFAEMKSRHLGQFRYHLYAAPTYLERAGEPLGPGDLLAHRLLVRAREGENTLWALRKDDDLFELPPAANFASNDPWIVKLAAVHGHGICFLPTFFARLEEQAGMLTKVLPDWQSDLVTVSALYWSHRYANPNLSLLLDKASANFGEIDHYLYRATRPENSERA